MNPKLKKKNLIIFQTWLPSIWNLVALKKLLFFTISNRQHMKSWKDTINKIYTSTNLTHLKLLEQAFYSTNYNTEGKVTGHKSNKNASQILIVLLFSLDAKFPVIGTLSQLLIFLPYTRAFAWPITCGIAIIRFVEEEEISLRAVTHYGGRIKTRSGMEPF